MIIIYVDSGIKSVILIPIIIASEKLKQNEINLFICDSLNFKKITKLPKTVDKPAMVEISKGPIISMQSPLYNMNYFPILVHNTNRR